MPQRLIEIVNEALAFHSHPALAGCQGGSSFICNRFSGLLEPGNG
jgi:hypothetical protein